MTDLLINDDYLEQFCFVWRFVFINIDILLTFILYVVYFVINTRFIKMILKKLLQFFIV